jgi:hypothetical protein
MNNKTQTTEAGVGMALWGRYKVQVLDANKNIVADYPWSDNMILNAGMDAIAVSCSLASCNAVGIVGTGTRPNTISGSTSQITQSGAQLFLIDQTGLPDFTSSYSAYAAAVQVGDVIIDSDGSESMVRSVSGSGMNLYVDNSASYSTGKNFVVFKTSQTRLQSESKRSSTYLAGSSSILGWNCGTVISESQVTMRRTYDFTQEVGPVVYTEGGVSWTSTANAQVFARYVFPYSVNMLTDFIFRMVHDFSVRYTPAIERYRTIDSGSQPVITNWPVAPATTTEGSESIQNFMCPTVDTNGGGAANCLDPAAFTISYSYGGTWASIFISEDSVALSPFGSATTRGSAVTYQSSAGQGYVPGSYTYVKATKFNIYATPTTNLYSIGLGQNYVVFPSVFYYPYQNGHQAFCFKFQQPQTKTNTQELFVGFRFTWDRVLDH